MLDTWLKLLLFLCTEASIGKLEPKAQPTFVSSLRLYGLLASLF